MNTIGRRIRRLEALQSPPAGPRLIVVGAPYKLPEATVAAFLVREGIERAASDLVVIVNSFRPVDGPAVPKLISITDAKRRR